MNPLLQIVTRPVKLFEAGDYGNKGKYDEARLDAWSADPSPIPFNITHSNEKSNPLHGLRDLCEEGMGVVRDFYRKGKEWWGILHTPKVISDLIDLTGKKGISIGVPPDLSRPVEISWEGNPHIKTAQVFEDNKDNFDEVAFAFSFDDAISESNLADVTITENQEALTVAENTENTEQTPEATQVETPVEKQEFSADEREAMNAENAKLKADLAEANRLLFAERDEAKVNQLEAKGKILPIHKEALLSFSGAGNINFSGEDTRVFDAVVKFMENYDVSAVFEATQPETTPVPNPIEEEASVFTADAETEKALARMAKMFGCSIEDLKKSNAHLAKSAKGAN